MISYKDAEIAGLTVVKRMDRQRIAIQLEAAELTISYTEADERIQQLEFHSKGSLRMLFNSMSDFNQKKVGSDEAFFKLVGYKGLEC